jgi:hypothetical protein
VMSVIDRPGKIRRLVIALLSASCPNSPEYHWNNHISSRWAIVMQFLLIIHFLCDLQNMTSSKRPAASSPAFDSPIQSSSKRGRRDGSAASVSD